MPELSIRPTAKFIKAGAILTAVVVIAAEIVYFAAWRDVEWLHPLPLLLPLLFLWPAARALRRQTSQAVIDGDRLRYETGMFSKSTRNIQLEKVQDVRVDQRFFQRLWNVGDISIETAGEASRLTIPSVDGPHALVGNIMQAARRGAPGFTS